MRILHTEASSGWGGQEMRILKEAVGLRDRGYEILFAVQRGGGLVAKARAERFVVYEVNFQKKGGFKTLFQLLKILRLHDIDVVNTHSSSDAWIAGIAARLASRKVVRTRHLSSPIRKGLNSRLLYNWLADFVVTTSSSIIERICAQSGRDPKRCRCIPTGVDPALLDVDPEEVRRFRRCLRAEEDDVIVGTACFVRSWKGIGDFLKAAAQLKEEPHLKWVVVGGGHVQSYIALAREMGLEGVVTFTGHLENPYAALRAMDIFALLSTANEGISQASLQAAYLNRPLITTPIGGLPEVCIDSESGILVPPNNPDRFAQAVLQLKNDPSQRWRLGARARQIVEERFTNEQMLQGMEAVFKALFSS